MSTINPVPSADTPITVKVTLGDGDSRRIKVALRDLGPNTLPEKLRQLLIIPVTQDIILERFSDSAGAYITLDSNNPSVYKQLYRAAKAKLKLRIKVSTVDSSGPKPPADDPEIPSTDHLSPNCYVPPTAADTTITPRATKMVFGPNTISPGGITPPPASFDGHAPPSPLLIQAKTENAARALASKLRQEPHAKPYMCPIISNAHGGPIHPYLFDGAKNTPTRTEAKQEASSPLILSALDKTFADSINKAVTFAESMKTVVDRHESLLRANQAMPATGSSFTICCNNCDAAIPNVHWHCSSCDNGDFDLCVECVNKGVLCDSKDHWLIKRFVLDGKVTNSITEKIEPRKASTIDAVPSDDSPAPKLFDCKTNMPNEDLAESRTCNSCVTVFLEENFYTCTVCPDYDLCTACLVGMKHGHHPNHALVPACKTTYSGPVISELCKPGRNMRHRAICDGCDKGICGVRHKCLDCPDWDYCSVCIESSRSTHPGHRFVPLWEPLPFFPQRLQRHYGIQCDGPLCVNKGAHDYIVGDRYKCAVCHDTDFCANCEALPTNRHNRTHPLIKIKTPIKNVSVTTVGEKDNGEPMITMGDQPPQTSSKSTETTPSATLANAATQVQPCGVIQPAETVKDESKTESTTLSDLDLQTHFIRDTKTPSVSDLQAHFIRDTIVDGTILPPSTAFHQVWTLRNPGPKQWPAGCSVCFIGGEFMHNVDWEHPLSVSELYKAAGSNTIDRVVEVGEEVEFGVIMKTPANEGRAVSYWRLKDAQGMPFGHRLWCDIQVCASQPKVDVEMQTKPVGETVVEDEARDDEENCGSQMIFPTLEKESPVASTHEAESEANTMKGEYKQMLEELENLDLDSGDEEEEDEQDDEDFLTDEEYDLIDMSDTETHVAPHRI